MLKVGDAAVECAALIVLLHDRADGFLVLAQL
jgi:hypothetical protein